MNEAKLEEAIAMLRAEYELASNQPFIRDPISYALYKTWKEFDEQSESQKN